MTALAISQPSFTDDFCWETPAFSESARQIDSFENEAVEHFKLSHTAKDALDFLIEDVFVTFEECSASNWDGYGAMPISVGSLRNILSFLKNFSVLLSFAEITPENDGEMAIEWNGASGGVFSLSFSENDIITYAGVFPDGTEVHGVEHGNAESFDIFSRFIKKTVSG